MATPDPPLQSRIVDDKSPLVIPFILERLAAYRSSSHLGSKRPFIVGLNGVQGVGKTTLVRALAETLRGREGLRALVVSIDDFYLARGDQLALAAAHPDNALVQCRGEPGTHDIPLMRAFFAALCAGEPTRVPQYDKSAFDGAGDRARPESAWPLVNAPGEPPVEVVVVEGWCVGFRALDPAEVERRWREAGAAAAAAAAAGPNNDDNKSLPYRSLHRHKLEHLLLVNERLRGYDAALTDLLDALVHIDAEDTAYVYDWRREQEAELRARTGGRGMTDEQVVRFVDAYYPAYELFADGVRRGVFLPDRPGQQLRLVVGRDRRVVDKIVL